MSHGRSPSKNSRPSLQVQTVIWVVKIMVPFWVPIIVRHLLFRPNCKRRIRGIIEPQTPMQAQDAFSARLNSAEARRREEAMEVPACWRLCFRQSCACAISLSPSTYILSCYIDMVLLRYSCMEYVAIEMLLYIGLCLNLDEWICRVASFSG